MKDAIGYLRVSTQEQGRSGLGLAAQRYDIETFAAKEGMSIKSWFQDIQTGAGRDALLLRPGLARALKEARVLRCPVIVSRLDRLSRNVHFITYLRVARGSRATDDLGTHQSRSRPVQETAGPASSLQTHQGFPPPPPGFRWRSATPGGDGARRSLPRAHRVGAQQSW